MEQLCSMCKYYRYGSPLPYCGLGGGTIHDDETASICKHHEHDYFKKAVEAWVDDCTPKKKTFNLRS